jgi:hypothetical protein
MMIIRKARQKAEKISFMIFDLKRIDENTEKRLRWFLRKYDFGDKFRK